MKLSNPLPPPPTHLNRQRKNEMIRKGKKRKIVYKFYFYGSGNEIDFKLHLNPSIHLLFLFSSPAPNTKLKQFISTFLHSI